VRELCTNFGEIACIWFDGDWPHHPFSEKDQYFKPGGSFEYETLFARSELVIDKACAFVLRRDRIVLVFKKVAGGPRDSP
jgi:hypothetical protein